MRQTMGKIPEVRNMLERVPELAKRGIQYMAEFRAQTLESVAAYSFLLKEFDRPPVTQNYLFQFVYRSFYRMDNAGLLPNFHNEYFKLMAASRGEKTLDLRALAWKLYNADFNRKNRPSIQSSFVTKLAHTVSPDVYPIYDSEITKDFGFRQPVSKRKEERLEQCLEFHCNLQLLYKEILRSQMMDEQIRNFCDQYVASGVRLPPLKIIDFIFWSAGKHIRGSNTKN